MFIFLQTEEIFFSQIFGSEAAMEKKNKSIFSWALVGIRSQQVSQKPVPTK